MSFLNKLTDWYKKQVAFITGDIRSYLSAEKRVKTAVLTSPILMAVGLFALYPLIGDPLLSATIAVLMAFAPWLSIVDVIASVSSFSKGVEEEMPFVVAMVAGVSQTGMELIEALRFLTRTKVFRAFKVLADRFWSLSETLGASEGLRLLSRMLRGRAKLFMLEYSATLASGTALHYLRDRATDFVKSAGVEFERSMTARMMLAMAVSMTFSLLPVILISIATLYTLDVERLEIGVETPPWLQAVPGVVALATGLMCILLPGYPMSAGVVVGKRPMYLYRAMFATGTAMLALPVPLLMLANDANTFRDLANTVAVASIVLGAPSFITTFRALNMALDDIVEAMANHVRVYRSMHLYRDEKLETLARKPVKPWLVDYLKESAEFFRLIGDVDPNVFELFVNFVFEVQRIKQRASIYMFVMLGAAAASPLLAVATLQLGGAFGQTAATMLMGYATTLSFGYIASKIATGRNISTLLPGIATLIYTAML